MATLLLQVAGSYLGGLFGAVGSTIGAAAGAYGGYLIDQSLINSSRRIQGQRLSSPQALTGEDGAPLARVYGTVRQGGTLFWATRFEEASKTERQGSKGGGPKVTTYTYYANFAVAVCEGEIAHVRRIWADGKELDLGDHTIRVYPGSADQLPDPLIEAKQGTGNAPAYRGTAYVVFDRFALADYGNRIPQMQFEVIRTVGGISRDIEAITIIPGSTEFGLSPTPVSQVIQQGQTVLANRSILNAGSDWESSIDELQALCPNLKRVALVVSWFGNDLRAGNCQIKPKTTTTNAYQNDRWKVAGLTRATADAVSQFDNHPAFGGTPDDASVIAAIQDLKSRGLKVTLYPFVLMDIPTDNALPSPYGGSSQPAYPWRGEISCFPAPGMSGSVDGTVSAAAQVSGFTGGALASSFGSNGNAVTYAGSVDWGYRRFILHYAKLAQLAGGVDGFLIGSEFKALTRVRAASGFPFVATLGSLATDVRSMLGANVKLTYGADWSEYGAYTPPGTSDLYFHLDPLWANPAINAIGIDNYMPLADWRDADWAGGNPDGFSSPNDFSALKNAITSAEGYDWYYATNADRQARVRTPIQDGLAGKDWVYRFKDLKGWWSNAHFERVNGVENATPTAWIAQSKPVWFTELGCPAIDKAANQPNVFPDAKSSSAAIPYFSNGGRDDEAQQRFLVAHYAHWSASTNNPVSNQYAGRMVDLENTYLWAWDARPFPAFPVMSDKWADGNNWLTGHWLNGRLSTIALKDLVSSIFVEYGVGSVDTTTVDGVLGGYSLDRPGTVREALDTLLALYRVDVSEQAGTLLLRSRDQSLPNAIKVEGLAFGRDDTMIVESLESANQAPSELLLEFRDALRDHQQASVTSRINHASSSMESIALPATMEASDAAAQLRQFHRQQSLARNTVVFTSSWADAALQIGDMVQLMRDGASYRIKKITDTQVRQYEAELAMPSAQPVRRSGSLVQRNLTASVSGQPLSVFLDLPALPTTPATAKGLRLAAWSKPWSPVVALASAGSDTFVQKLLLADPALIGTLVTSLPAGMAGRISTRDWFEIDLVEGGLASLADLFVFNGANSAAVKSANGAWEILQFAKATEVSTGRWRLERLLRGQLGTIDAMLSGAQVGARFVFLDASVKSLELTDAEADVALNWKVGPVSKAVSDTYYVTESVPAASRAAKANAPVHLKATRRAAGDTVFNWKRCGTVNADSWDAAEIPLPESVEQYEVKILDTNQLLKRTTVVSSTQWTYAAAERQLDLGPAPATCNFEISQVSANGLPGIVRKLSLTI
jgi:hypothetical protein